MDTTKNKRSSDEGVPGAKKVPPSEKELTCNWCGEKCLRKQCLDEHYDTDHGWWDAWWNTMWDTPGRTWPTPPESFPKEQSSNSSKKET